MKNDTTLSEEQLIHQAIEVLIEKIGVLETMRFLALKNQGRVDSVIRHQQWQITLDKDTFYDKVFGE